MSDLPPIVFITLWPVWACCQRCDASTLDPYCWPYYEDFIHTESPGPHGHVPICNACHDWLVANEATLPKRDADGVFL